MGQHSQNTCVLQTLYIYGWFWNVHGLVVKFVNFNRNTANFNGRDTSPTIKSICLYCATKFILWNIPPVTLDKPVVFYSRSVNPVKTCCFKLNWYSGVLKVLHSRQIHYELVFFLYRRQGQNPDETGFIQTLGNRCFGQITLFTSNSVLRSNSAFPTVIWSISSISNYSIHTLSK